MKASKLCVTVVTVIDVYLHFISHDQVSLSNNDQQRFFASVLLEKPFVIVARIYSVPVK